MIGLSCPQGYDLIRRLPRDKIVVVGGPTASGKSAWALDGLADEGQDCCIINGDSIQCYGGLPLLSAQPSQEEQKILPHYLYEFLRPETLRLDAAQWKEKVHQVFELHKDARRWVVGGSGFYLKALMRGLSPLPSIEVDLKAFWFDHYKGDSLETLQEKVKSIDPEAALQDKNRMISALTVYHVTGKPVSYWHKIPPKRSPYSFYRVLLWPQRDLLREKVTRRFRLMWDQGLATEVETFHHTAPLSSPLRKALGFKEILHEIQKDKVHKTSGFSRLEEAYVTRVMQYAKQQCTWFRYQFSPHHVVVTC